MSWQLASFALVIAALGLAFWWYEHFRPPAKLIAVVATLAALGALGRDAFAAVPDVKPITVIVLVSGLAFGAAPGFAVGAIAGFASNLLLGEGPWTPWQMLGWGVVGLIGAALARLTARRVPPLLLALVCALSAEVFNLIVNVYTWTGTGNHTLAAFGFVLGTAVVFDLTHVIASFAFALAFGSVLLRMLERVRTRLDVQWEPYLPAPAGSQAGVAPRPMGLSAIVLALALAVAAFASPRPAHAATASASAAVRSGGIARQITFIAAAQNSDGGFGGASGQPSSELYSAWVAMGLAAAGRDPLSLSRDGHTVLDSIRGQAASLQGAGDLERTILALHACGVSVHSLPGGDPVKRLLRSRAGDGSFEHLGNLTAFAIFALRAAGYAPRSPIVHDAGSWLAHQQDPDGGFGFATRGAGSDVDDTAAILQALIDSRAASKQVLARASAYLVKAQNPDGGYPQEAGGQSNAQSSAWAIQALTAAGRNVETIHRQGSRSPLGYLESLLGPEGSVRYSRTGAQTPVWVTAEALTAFAGKPFPIAPVRAAKSAYAARPMAATLSAALARLFTGLSGAL